MVERKKIGFRAMIFLIVLSVLMYLREEAHLGRRALIARRDPICKPRAPVRGFLHRARVVTSRRNAATSGGRVLACRAAEWGAEAWPRRSSASSADPASIRSQGFTPTREERVATPWGEPSDALRFGRFGETDVVFLARHGRGHRFSPSTINYRANIDALKRAGVTDIIAISACGSYKRELYPGLFVLADQFIDRTFKRETSFFGTGCVAHVPFAHPISAVLRKRVAAAAAAEGVAVQIGGTYVCMEGPQFSTYAESLHLSEPRRRR